MSVLWRTEGANRLFVGAYGSSAYVCRPHRAGRDSQVCCEAGGKMLTARSPRLDSGSCWRSACHCLLGSFSDSLAASLSAGSSSSEGIIIDTPRGIVGAIVGAAVVMLAYHARYPSFRKTTGRV